MGREMYDIKEFKDLSEIYKEEREKVKLKQQLEKKFGIIDGAFGIHKTKYEKEISIKEKIVFEKEKEKLKLLKEMRNETIRNEQLLNKIKEMYEPIQKMEYEENDIIENENHAGIMDELIKKEKEKESLLKETNLINEEIKELINTKKFEKSKIEESKSKIENEKNLNESKSNLNSSRKPKLDFGKNTLNNNNIHDFSHLLVDENEKEEEKEPLDEPIADDEENNDKNNNDKNNNGKNNNDKNYYEYEEPIEIDKGNQNVYFDKEEVDEKKNNFENEENNINNKVNKEEEKNENNDNINEEINNEEINNEEIENEKIKNEELLKERDEKFIKNFHEKMDSKDFNNKIENEEEEMNDEEREKQFNELLKEAQPKKGKDSHPVDFNHFHDII